MSATSGGVSEKATDHERIKIVKLVNDAFTKQTAIPKSTAKEKLQRIYDTLGISRTAKASDLAN